MYYVSVPLDINHDQSTITMKHEAGDAEAGYSGFPVGLQVRIVGLGLRMVLPCHDAL